MTRIIYPVIGNQTQLPFYLTGVGVDVQEGNVVRSQGLVSHQFLMTLEGEGELVVGGKTYPQKTGDGFYLSPGVPHAYHPKASHWKTAWAVFRGNLLVPVMSGLDFPQYRLYDDSETAGMSVLLEEILSSAQDSIGGSERCSALVYQLILRMYRTADAAANPGGISDRIAQTVDYLDKHFSEDITVPQLAAMAGVSVQHFCRTFRSRMGMRPVEYLARRRIACAKELLLHSRKSITEISEFIGYTSVTYFGMVFRKYEGTTPTDYRKQNGVQF